MDQYCRVGRQYRDLNALVRLKIQNIHQAFFKTVSNIENLKCKEICNPTAPAFGLLEKECTSCGKCE